MTPGTKVIEPEIVLWLNFTKYAMISDRFLSLIHPMVIEHDTFYLDIELLSQFMEK